jgi:hypothetical protein
MKEREEEKEEEERYEEGRGRNWSSSHRNGLVVMSSSGSRTVKCERLVGRSIFGR